jgi:RNase P/RNase MRP subunit p30
LASSGAAAVVVAQSSNKAKTTTWQGLEKEQQALIKRLISTGYSTVAISHLIYGNEKISSNMNATSVIPDSVLNMKEEGEEQTLSKKRKRNASTTSRNSNSSTNSRTKGTRMLRRLNVVIEQESDLANYSYNVDSKTKHILLSYDIIAFSPRNETVLSAICKSQNLFFCDIIMLDYTAGRGNVQLPFKLKPSYVSAATERGIAFELDYASALIDFSKRKAFVQASRQLLNACVGVLKPKPRIILCSGDRVLDGRDYASMVLRSGLDMVNFCQVVLGFKPDLASKVLGEHASLVVERGQNRKCGKVKNEIVTFVVVRGDEIVGGVEGHEVDAEEQEAENDDDDFDDRVEKHEKGEEVDNEQNKHSLKGNDLHVGVNSKSSHDDDDDDDDGFMKFS